MDRLGYQFLDVGRPFKHLQFSFKHLAQSAGEPFEDDRVRIILRHLSFYLLVGLLPFSQKQLHHTRLTCKLM